MLFDVNYLFFGVNYFRFQFVKGKFVYVGVFHSLKRFILLVWVVVIKICICYWFFFCSSGAAVASKTSGDM